LDAHPDICAKGEGHFTDLLFPKIATALDDYNSESDQISNRLQLASLPGNAAGYTFDDVDHVLRVAIGMALDRWLDRRDEAVSAWEFNLGISRGNFPKKFPNFASFAEKFAQTWSRSIGAGRKFGWENQARYLEIQSSDITANPSKVVAALLDFSVVSSTQKIAQNCADMAWDISPLDVEHGVWETTFDDEANRLFLRHGGELIKLLNYD